MGHTGVTTTVSIRWDLIDVHVGVETTDYSPVVDVKVQMYKLTVQLIHSRPPHHP